MKIRDRDRNRKCPFPSLGTGRAERFLKQFPRNKVYFICMSPPWRLLLLNIVLAIAPVRAQVIINEIMYHAPGDLRDLQFVELRNASDQAVDLSGWTFSKGVEFTFPAASQIPAGGYGVVCQNRQVFQSFYDTIPLGEFKGNLKRSGERLQLCNVQGEVVDAMRYDDRAPWPRAADGFSATLERISQNISGSLADNWTGSPLSTDPLRPGGSPGKLNSIDLADLPPIVSHVESIPASPGPSLPIIVVADVTSDAGLREVELLYRVASVGSETGEKSIPMTPTANNRFRGIIPGQPLMSLVRFRISATDTMGLKRVHPAPTEPRPAISIFVHTRLIPDRVPWVFLIQTDGDARHRDPGGRAPRFLVGRPPEKEPPVQGHSAVVWVEPGGHPPKVFDFVTVADRPAGRKVHFHKDRPLNGMSTISLIFEENERFILAEPLAFALYHKAGNTACRTDFVRVWDNGRPVGYQLLVEQPNKAFLHRNGLRDDGNLYKLLWYENGLTNQHEKKTNPYTGHGDLKKLVTELNRTQSAEQWELIRREFNIEQVITYFAVNSLLSYWDGFFNDYFTYHDIKGTGKWEMYPWDQDKTFGYYDGIPADQTFYKLPLSYGAAGDVPPGWTQARPPQNLMEVDSPWWRPGGWFSKPLLANPQLRPYYLARIRELLETAFTEERLYPILDGYRTRLEGEVAYRAGLRGEKPERAQARFDRNIASIKENISQRRKWLLAQREIRSAGAFDRTKLR